MAHQSPSEEAGSDAALESARVKSLADWGGSIWLPFDWIIPVLGTYDAALEPRAAPLRCDGDPSRVHLVHAALNLIGLAILLVLSAACGRSHGERLNDAESPVGGGCDASATGDPDTLGPGIGYCIRNQAYPHGYYTMNCGSDRDCPSPSRCDDGNQCRLPCSSNDECVSPTTCRPHGTPPLSFCECGDCVLGM